MNMSSQEVTRRVHTRRYTVQSYLLQRAPNPHMLALGILCSLNQQYSLVDGAQELTV
jgi:hypothetical protein